MWIINGEKGESTLAGCNSCARKSRRGAVIKTTSSARISEYVAKHSKH